MSSTRFGHYDALHKASSKKFPLLYFYHFATRYNSILLNLIQGGIGESATL